MTETYLLGTHLDSSVAPTLAAEILQLRGKDVVIDAGGVDFAGALSLQALVSARKQWDEDGLSFRIHPMSGGFESACTSLGFPLEKLCASGEEISLEEVV